MPLASSNSVNAQGASSVVRDNSVKTAYQIPTTMRAAVYRGGQQVSIDEVAVPAIGPGEILIRVEACGICHTDLKKIEYDLLPGPRIYGHETAGEIAAMGADVTKFALGDRVAVFHHIPCENCFYCERKLFAQCPVYKKVGVTAGFEPAGGGFGQYVRVMNWIVEKGVVKIPTGVSYERASFIEPVNTCVKAVALADPRRGDTILVQGQGPIGLVFTMLLARLGVNVVATDTMPARLDLARKFGAAEAWDPRATDVSARLKELTQGRGADQVFSATSAKGLVDEAMRATRPGAKVLLFAQTSANERVEVSGADLCVGERMLYGSYSASVQLQEESARLVLSGELPVEELVSHRIGLDDWDRGFHLALHPEPKSLKIIVQPQRKP